MHTRLLIGTTNRGKHREIRSLLATAPVELVSLSDLPPIGEPEETGVTFRENARVKALHYGAHFDGLTVGEDSGLVIDALGGEPGVRSARFLRPDASYPERFEEIFRRLAERPGVPRTARFVCALAVSRAGDILFETTGIVEGEITRRASGTGGFGYDPIFYYPPCQRTLAAVSETDKLRHAHRGHAFRALAEWLKTSVP